MAREKVTVALIAAVPAVLSALATYQLAWMDRHEDREKSKMAYHMVSKAVAELQREAKIDAYERALLAGRVEEISRILHEMTRGKVPAQRRISERFREFADDPRLQSIEDLAQRKRFTRLPSSYEDLEED